MAQVISQRGVQQQPDTRGRHGVSAGAGTWPSRGGTFPGGCRSAAHWTPGHSVPTPGRHARSGSLGWLWGLALGLVENSPGRSTWLQHHFQAGDTQMMRKTDRQTDRRRAGSQEAMNPGWKTEHVQVSSGRDRGALGDAIVGEGERRLQRAGSGDRHGHQRVATRSGWLPPALATVGPCLKLCQKLPATLAPSSSPSGSFS